MMMTPEETARKFDEDDRPLEAAEAYEHVLRSGGGDLELCLDAVVLYLECCDGGYIAHHKLPDAFVKRAYGRAL